MVEFDVVLVRVDPKSTKEQLERKLHPAIRVLIKQNKKVRWIQVNLDKFKVVNNCYDFSGILSHTIYIGGRTIHQESDLHGWYSLDHQLGGLTIF